MHHAELIPARSTEDYEPPEISEARITDRYDVWGLFMIALYVLNAGLPSCLVDRDPKPPTSTYRKMIEQEIIYIK